MTDRFLTLCKVCGFALETTLPMRDARCIGCIVPLGPLGRGEIDETIALVRRIKGEMEAIPGPWPDGIRLAIGHATKMLEAAEGLRAMYHDGTLPEPSRRREAT